MKSGARMASALFEAPGPRARRRHTWYAVLVAVVTGGAVCWAFLRFSDAGQFDARMWEAFEYRGVQLRILAGVVDTFKAFVLSVVLSLALGFLFAAGRLSAHRVLRWPAGALVEFFRAVPVIITVFALYATDLLRTYVTAVADVLRRDFGSPGGWVADNFASPTLWALVIGIALYNGAAQAEILRAGVGAVPRGQFEAGYALGMRKTQVMTAVVMPQAVRTMLPSIISQMVVTLKDTSLGFFIMYEELLYAGKLLAQNTATPSGYPYLPVLCVVGSLYIIMCLLLSRVARHLAARNS
ncbi:ABC transporter permease subunit [Streptomyces sp. BG9H]|uniref:ABC transporter permease subunit n=2 Tax=Streptomyces anatolicus TaxID=2675858 RepID=A0ABS6YP62_9ACTN|nr:ABC transporter permease subunit [Streptomyces anatolicus]